MANRATIERKAFITIKPENPTDLSDIEFGYVIFDDYEQEYGTNFMPDDMKLSDLDFLHRVRDNLNETGQNILDSAIEKGGIYINGTWYEIEVNEEGDAASIVFKKPEQKPELPYVTELSVFHH